MSRYRLYPAPEQVAVLLGHCSDARMVWNAGLEQRLWWRVGRVPAPRFAEQCRQLTEARAEFDWLQAGSQMMQQQALRDLDQAWRNFFAGTHRRPTWRKQGMHDGFRVVGKDWHVRRLNRKWSAVTIPKVGWVKFRRTIALPASKSYRVTLKAGQWHIAFAVIPEPIPAPGTGEIVGVDRGVVVSFAYSDGRKANAPVPITVKMLQRCLARAKRGSNRRRKLRAQLTRLHARNARRLKDFVEKETTRVAREYDLIRVEDLKIQNMTRSAKGAGRKAKAGLNRGILNQGWGLFVQRLEHKALGRVEKVPPAFTSQTCHACKHVAKESRESQAVFRCVACGHQDNADTNAARNIAAGHAVRGAGQLMPVLSRVPQLTPP